MEVSTLSNIPLPWGSTGPKEIPGEQQGYLFSHRRQTGTKATLDCHVPASNLHDAAMKRCQLHFYPFAL